MILVGADLATTTGWCYGRPDETPQAFAVRGPSGGDDYGPYAAFYMDFFENQLQRLAAGCGFGQPIKVCYESPILPQPVYDPEKRRVVARTSIATTRRLHFLGPLLEGVCLRTCDRTGVAIEVVECQIQKIKRELAGFSGAAKSDMVFAARRAGIVLPAGEEAKDAADAFGAWITAQREFAPQHTPMWDRRLFAPPQGQERLSAAEARKLF